MIYFIYGARISAHVVHLYKWHRIFLSDNQQDHVNQNKDDIDSPPDFMLTLFIQQNAEIKTTSSPRSPRRPSLAIIMQQNEVTKNTLSWSDFLFYFIENYWCPFWIVKFWLNIIGTKYSCWKQSKGSEPISRSRCWSFLRTWNRRILWNSFMHFPFINCKET